MSDNLSPPGLFERMHRACRVHGVALWAEKLYPTALGTVAGLMAGTSTFTEAQVDALVTDVLPVAISVTAILAGFQATAKAMMLAIIRSEAVEFLKRTGHYGSVVGYLWGGVLLASLVRRDGSGCARRKRGGS